MGDQTGIEWTDASWNPIVGCQLASDRVLKQPMRWQKPKLIFVNSMGDLFADGVGPESVNLAFTVMALSPHHRFQLLTKRPEQMRRHIERFCREGVRSRLGKVRPDVFPLKNLWVGTSVENQATARARVPTLCETPARVRFVSCEPLLGPVSLERYLTPSGAGGGVDWVIVGGESGPEARPMRPEWAREIRDACMRRRVPFFFKQWGEWAPPGAIQTGLNSRYEGALWARINGYPPRWLYRRDQRVHDSEAEVYRVGKKRAGRVLDGMFWDEMPEARYG